MTTIKSVVRFIFALFCLIAVGVSISSQSLAADQNFDFSPAPASATPPNSVTAPQEYEPDALLVRYKASMSDSSVKKSAERHGALTIKQLKTHNKLPKNRSEQWSKLQFKPGEDLQQTMARLKQDPNVEVVEPNYIVTENHLLASNTLPTDAYFSDLWGMNNEGQCLNGICGTDDADIDAPEAWRIHTGDGESNVVVGVIDTGVDYMHNDLIGNIWVNPNEAVGDKNGDGCPGVCNFDDDGDLSTDEGLIGDDDENGYVDDFRGWDFVNNDNNPMDDAGHGTHVAGTIAARANNGGVAGVSWHAKIMPLKFLGSNGRGSIEGAILALNYATKMGVKITNNSWSCMVSNCFSQALYDAIEAANVKESLFVAAAGNDGENDVPYPAKYDLPNIISVAATDRDDKIANFSNYNLTTVDLGAPGVRILSSLPDGICSSCPMDTGGDYYGLADGTSMASPHVAGAAALLKSFMPGLTALQIKDKILNSADPIPSLADKTLTGSRLNVHKLLTNSHFLQSASPANRRVVRGNSVMYTLSYTSYDNWSGTVNLSVDLDSEVTGVLAQSVLTINVGQTTTTTVTFSASSLASYGIHRLTVRAVDEQGISDTLKIYLTVIPKVDLVVTDVSTAEVSFTVGIPATVSTQVKNLGSEATTASSTVNIYLSRDAVITTDDILIGSRIINSLAAWASSSASTQVTIPLAITNGTYYLGAIADAYNTQLETNENNNALAGKAFPAVRDIDLVTTAVSTTATRWPLNGYVVVSATIKNQGTTPAFTGHSVGIYLSTDTTLSSGDIYLNSIDVPDIAGGASSTVSATVLIPTTLIPGTSYYLLARADVDNKQPETNETNNTLAGAALTAVRDVDLVPTAVKTTAKRWPLNGYVTVSTTIMNKGTTPTTNGYSVSIYLSTDTAYSGTDIYLGNTGVPALAGGASTAVSTSLLIPTTLTPGVSYYLLALVDPERTQPETNETNNALAGAALVAVRDVDLVPTAVNTTATRWPLNGYVTVNSTIKNQGATPTTNGYSVSIYLSTDTAYSGTDIYLGNTGVPALAGGASTAVSTSLLIPTTLTPSVSYYLLALVDPERTQPETNETNNALAGAVLIAVRDIDLIPTAVSTTATRWPLNSYVIVSATIKNQGTTPTITGHGVGIYLSTDATLSSGDIYLGSVGVPNLLGGASTTVSTSLLIPTTLLPGTSYYLLARADVGNTQPETNETNNALTGAALVAVQ